MSENDNMDALTNMLAGAPAEAGLGIEHLCRRSAQKAVEEVVDFFLHRPEVREGVYRLRYTEVSEGAVRDVVRKAIDRCTELGRAGVR